MKSFIKGKYKKSIYSSDKGYIIGLFKIEETDNSVLSDFIDKTITFTGYFHELNDGDQYIFKGEEVEHPKYGLQFNVSEYEKVKPEDRDGVIEFLSSDLFPTVGKKLATSIVEQLGNKALDLILKDYTVLNTIPKITKKKIDIIYNNLIKYDESHQVIVDLTEIGFNMKDALSIYNTFLKETRRIIDNDIYRIIDEVDDISFVKVDQIALKMNVDYLDRRRLKALIIYAIKAISFKQGDTYLNYEEIYNSVCNYINEIIDDSTFNNYLNELVNEQRIYIQDRKYYLIEMYEAEQNILNKIRMLKSIKPIKYKRLDDYIKTHEEINNITYNDDQIEAIKSALTENILIITGGPGTGKTTIIKEIVTLYREVNKLSYKDLINDLALLAPTGRASKRMSESTGYPATTIHRFLKWNKESNRFAVNEYEKDFSKLIIIDEVSMIDQFLLDNLFKGLTDNIKLILVGDYNQLPSVGQGQILKDLIESEVIKTIRLNRLYRQEENSYITTLAYEIKDNNLGDYLKTRDDYTFLECKSSSIRANLSDLCKKIINKGYDYGRMQVMAPMYHGEVGIDILNKDLQQIFNPRDKHKNEIMIGDVIYRENDKILQLVNMPDDNVYNGDIGIIKNIVIKDNKKEIYVDYDGNLVKYDYKDFNKIKHGFVISIHKSQGSEFDMVIIPMSNTYHRMLYRKLIYTGVTRAKKKLILIGEPSAFTSCVSNNQELIRKTSLKENLIIMNNYLKHK